MSLTVNLASYDVGAYHPSTGEGGGGGWCLLREFLAVRPDPVIRSL